MTATGDIQLASIVAVADNGVIGNNNAMPWHIPSEFAHFRATTIGKPVIMGRKSFEALGKPLAKRTNIVVTRDTTWSAAGVTVCHTLDDAIAAGKHTAHESGVDTVFIIGGADIYRQAMDVIDVLYLTEIHLSPAGETYFPDFDRARFHEIFREEHPQREGEAAGYTVTILERKT